MILTGDCVTVMAGMEPDSFDAIVTDPPYGLEFMGKEWDSFRVDDPGTQRHRGERAGSHGEATTGDSTHPARAGVAVAFGGGKRPTTFRCVGCGKRDQFRNSHACSDPQWRKEIIDPHAAPPTMLAFQEWCRVWATEAYRVAKPGAHLLAFGGTRTYHRLTCAIEDAGWEIRDCLVWAYASGFPKSLNLNGDHKGWGTALKPAWEPIVLARKPLAGTVAANVERWGTGALNIDGTRIPMSAQDSDRIANMGGYGTAGWTPTQAVAIEGAVDGSLGQVDSQVNAAGRWPPNLLLTEVGYGDTGGYARFFLVPKASRSDREPVWGEELDVREGTAASGDLGPVEGNPRKPDNGHVSARRNVHPTVKPIDLMRHLVRLVTPPGGVVLDPFLGSGTTAIAAIMEGFGWVGIELDPEYARIATARLNGVQTGAGL